MSESLIDIGAKESFSKSVIGLLYGGMMKYLDHVEKEGVESLISEYYTKRKYVMENAYFEMAEEEKNNTNQISSLIKLFGIIAGKIEITLYPEQEILIFLDSLKTDYIRELIKDKKLKKKLLSFMYPGYKINDVDISKLLDNVEKIKILDNTFLDIFDVIVSVINCEEYLKFFSEFIEELNSRKEYYENFNTKFFTIKNINEVLIDDEIYKKL